MAQRPKITETKQLEVNAKLHHKIKAIAFEHGVEMRALANAILKSVRLDEKRLAEIVADVEAAPQV